MCECQDIIVYNYLAALLALPLLQLAMHPVMMGGCLLAILTDAHIPIRWLAGQLSLLVHQWNAVMVRHQLAGRALHTLSTFLQQIQSGRERNGKRLR